MSERRADHVKRRRHTPEQIVRKLREADRMLAAHQHPPTPRVAVLRENGRRIEAWSSVPGPGALLRRRGHLY
jgi:hypothetical protein